MSLIQTPRQKVKELIAFEGARYGVTYDEIMSGGRTRGGMKGQRNIGRTKPIVQARWSAMERIRLEFNKSYPEVGVIFKRDHSSCMYGIKLHRQRNRFLPVPIVSK